MNGTLTNTQTNEQHPLMQYPRPKRVVRTFNIYLSGKKCEAVTTRGEKYTYLTIEGIDFYVNGLLPDDGRYKAVLEREKVPPQ